MSYLKNGNVYADKVGEIINLFDSGYTSATGGVGSNGNDMVRGNGLNNRLDGGAGDDQLWGGSGGDDTMLGGSGGNAYWWGRGDGHDQIIVDGAAKGDALILYNVQRNQYSGFNSNGNLQLVANDGAVMDLKNWYTSDASRRLQSFVFADNIAYAWNNGQGAEVNLYQSIYEANGTHHVQSIDSGNCTLRGGSGADIVEGGTGADQLWGGTDGSDTLLGGAGADMYWWGISDGNDVIGAASSNTQDSINLYNVRRDQLSVSLNGNDCTLQVGSESVTIKDWKTSSLDVIQFADHSTASLKSLVQVVPTSHQFKIQFDYSFDSTGFFSNHPDRQRDLEAAANYWSQHISENFATVKAGTKIRIANPQTSIWQNVTLNSDIDDVKIYVGAYNLQNGATAQGVAATVYNNISTDSLYQRDHNLQQYQPWAGSITFDSSPQYSGGETANWWFDPTPSDGSDAATLGNSQYDFVTVAIHEIGHILGLSSNSDAFNYQKNPYNNNSFIGIHAEAANQGRPIPLIDGTHPNGYDGNFNQEVVMAYGGATYVGHRIVPSSIDLGMLSDIGYHTV